MAADERTGSQGANARSGLGRSGAVDALIMAWLQGRATPAEEDALREWRRSSPVHERYCRELERTWQLTAAPTSRRETPVWPAPSAGSIIARAATVTRRARMRRVRQWLPWGGIAAAAVVIASVLGIRLVRGGLGAAADATRVLTTGPSVLATVTLRDGTIVRLGPNTTLHVARDPASRVVFLSGRAYFAVAHRDGAAFRVQTEAGDVEVTGTRFAVEAHGRSMRTMVLQGTVATIADGRRALVHAGEVGQVTDGGQPQVGELADAFGDVDGWVGDLISFEATPLDEVARELARHYHTRVTLSDTVLAERTVTASYTNWTLPAILASICQVADVYCTTGANGVTISPRDSSAAPAHAGIRAHSRSIHPRSS